MHRLRPGLRRRGGGGPRGRCAAGERAAGPASDAFAFEWAPDGASLPLAGTLQSATNQERFVTPAVGGSVPVKVSGTMQANGNANGGFFGFSPLGN